MSFTKEELKKRSFERAAAVLYSFWEEQRENNPRTVAVHSRLFDTLIYNEYIELNEKTTDRKYPEHVVSCAYIRNLAFEMFWNDKCIDDVAEMIGKLLRIAYIRPEEAKRLDAVHKYTMPKEWDWEKDSLLRRLEDSGIEVIDLK